MNLFEAIKAMIDVNGYDGLANPEIECGCGGDTLMICEEPDLIKCEFAIKYKNLFYPVDDKKVCKICGNKRRKTYIKNRHNIGICRKCLKELESD